MPAMPHALTTLRGDKLLYFVFDNTEKCLLSLLGLRRIRGEDNEAKVLACVCFNVFPYYVYCFVRLCLSFDAFLHVRSFDTKYVEHLQFGSREPGSIPVFALLVGFSALPARRIDSRQ